jgi:multidrug resistance efflux pump
MNALRHGFRSREHIETARFARHTLRVAARNLAIIRAHLRLLRQQKEGTLSSDLSAEAQRAKAEAQLGLRPNPRRRRHREEEISKFRRTN